MCISPYYRVDLVLLSGDIADMPMDYGYDESDTAKKFKESYYEDLHKVVEAIANINDRVYYIPGNVSTSTCMEL